ncbi:MATE family efflux transporter [Schaalia sp. lx-260]|uniref:MATE family efflux transporter n=1 Tax=Schaalia sp. lx-260 TaxID=2899082 RepID=UPI001E5E950A|nr:MATE family efflux transporter [Schaalia sp. lx-260]MCD4550075.1 MATE family efflux transporter [Schaalia sp. lx-260]
MPRSTDLTSRVLTLALPALASLIAEPLFTLIDSSMIGHLGTNELAGQAVASQILMTAVTLFIFLSYSTTSLSARALGSGDDRKAIRSGIDAIWLACGLGIITTALLIVLGPTLTGLFHTTPEVAPHALSYLYSAAPGTIGMFITMAAVGTFRGMQDTRTPMVITLIGTLLNILLNALFIYGFEWGVAGSGAGTSLAQTAMGAIMAGLVLRHAHTLNIPLSASRSGLWGAVLEGAPLMVRGMSLRLVGLLLLWPATTLGTKAVASYQIILSIWIFACFLLDALAIAAQTMVGISVGSKNQSQLRELLHTLNLWGLWTGVLIGITIAITSPWLPYLFTSDTAMYSITTWGLIASALGMPIGGVVFLLDGVLIGAGEGRFMATASVLQLLITLPALAVVNYLCTQGISPEKGVAALWMVYCVFYMGSRLFCNVWRTWYSPQHALVTHSS